MAPSMSAEEWQALADRHFGFLRTDFQFLITGSSEENWWSARTVYQNSTTAVEVFYSGQDERVYVLLVRLVDGKRPAAPTFKSEEPVLHHFPLDSLLKFRAPGVLETIKPHFSEEPAEVDIQLALWATALREFGADVLRGDFSVFQDLESEVRERLRLRPEQVTVWFPHTAAGPDEREIARLRSYHPTIPLVVREYVRPPHRLLGPLRRFLRRIIARR